MEPINKIINFVIDFLIPLHYYCIESMRNIIVWQSFIQYILFSHLFSLTEWFPVQFFVCSLFIHLAFFTRFVNKRNITMVGALTLNKMPESRIFPHFILCSILIYLYLPLTFSIVPFWLPMLLPLHPLLPAYVIVLRSDSFVFVLVLT